MNELVPLRGMSSVIGIGSVIQASIGESGIAPMVEGGRVQQTPQHPPATPAHPPMHAAMMHEGGFHV